LALFCIALELQGPVRADVVVGNPVFTDHAMTLHKQVNIDHPGVARELGRSANERYRHKRATAAAASFGDRVAASTGAGADR
jgi:hypothetical protein